MLSLSLTKSENENNTNEKFRQIKKLYKLKAKKTLHGGHVHTSIERGCIEKTERNRGRERKNEHSAAVCQLKTIDHFSLHVILSHACVAV